MPFSLKGVYPWARALTIAFVVAQIARLVDAFLYLRFLRALEAFQVSPELSPHSAEDLVAWEASYRIFGLPVGIVFLGVLIAVLIVNGMWIFRVASNARYFDPQEGRIGPGWAVGWHAVPVANLWMPFRAMRQTWNASYPEAKPMDAKVPLLFSGWWAAWIASNGILAGAQVMAQGEEIANQILINTANLMVAPLSAVSGVFFLLIIDRLTRMQWAKDKHYEPPTEAMQPQGGLL